jgi:hypothetical protein
MGVMSFDDKTQFDALDHINRNFEFPVSAANLAMSRVAFGSSEGCELLMTIPSRRRSSTADFAYAQGFAPLKAPRAHLESLYS